jgi:hypothetical protein
MAAQPVDAAIAEVLRQIGRAGASFRLEALVAGGNNRVFRVRTGSDSFLAKWYYHSEADARDRLRSEFSFLQHAWRCGIRCIPRPIASAPGPHIGLYEYVEGRRLAPHEITESRVLEAAALFAALNEPSSRRMADALPDASEACFTVDEHIAMVDARLARFAAADAESSIDREAGRLVEWLREAWARHKRRILSQSARPAERLPAAWRCLSPSDFGFHNALLRSDGTLCFLDFEYAGWDDPAKAFGDFFCHPGSPVSTLHRGSFVRDAAAPFPEREALIARARLLEPVFQVKWCCIILNEFLPGAAERRRFANPAMDPEKAKAVQLEKARRLSLNLDA